MAARALIPTLALAGVLAASSAFAAGEAAKPAQEPGFGQRDAFIVSVERLFGFQSQEFCEEDPSGDERCQTLESTGLHPTYWGHVGLFSMQASGLNFGSLFGFTYLTDVLEDDEPIAFLRVGPRIGYGGTLQKGLGYWVRVGPSFFGVFSDGDDSYTLAASAEALAVISPAPHLGITFGPNLDIHIWGKQGDEDRGYKAIGFSAGLMGEF